MISLKGNLIRFKNKWILKIKVTRRMNLRKTPNLNNDMIKQTFSSKKQLQLKPKSILVETMILKKSLKVQKNQKPKRKRLKNNYN